MGSKQRFGVGKHYPLRRLKFRRRLGFKVTLITMLKNRKDKKNRKRKKAKNNLIKMFQTL